MVSSQKDGTKFLVGAVQIMFINHTIAPISNSSLRIIVYLMTLHSDSQIAIGKNGHSLSLNTNVGSTMIAYADH